MKMKIHNILASCLLFVLASCYKEMPFRGMETDPQLFFQCLPGAQDTTVFWLRTTIPVNQELKEKEIVNPRMTFKVNGKEVELHLNSGESSTFPSEAYFAVEPLKPGDKLEFHAEADGFDPISAQTVIPQEIKDLTLSASIIPGPNPDYYVAALDDRSSQGIGKEVPQFKVTFQDQPGVRDCYMIEVTQLVLSSNGRPLPYGTSVAYVVPRIHTDLFEQAQTDVLLANHQSPWQTIDYDSGYNSNLVMFFDDKEFDGQKYTKEVMVNRLTSNGTTKYTFRLYRVSEELYKYAKAWDTARKAEYSEFPSATPFMSYNNIEGGNGIFAGVAVYDSGMIEIE